MKVDPFVIKISINVSTTYMGYDIEVDNDGPAVFSGTVETVLDNLPQSNIDDMLGTIHSTVRQMVQDNNRNSPRINK